MGTKLPHNFASEGPTELEIVRSALDDMMTDAFYRVKSISDEKGINFRIASFYKALNDISHVYDLYGLTI